MTGKSKDSAPSKGRPKADPSLKPDGGPAFLKGRLKAPMDPALAKASVSVGYDRRLAGHDLAGTRAHALMLAGAGLITEGELAAILSGLGALAARLESGAMDWDESLEDVHMNLERALTDLAGPAGAKIHTARSRNDQVALDERLYLIAVSDDLAGALIDLREALVDRAAGAGEAPMPGYTHLQRAQPVLLAHHLMAYYQMFTRDLNRLWGLRGRLLDMPLGSGALAGTGLPIDPWVVCEALAIPDLYPSPNSLDAVASRDLALEFLAFGAILAVHVSRLAEEIVLWTSSEFGFATLPDSLATTSSMMPQKKNPDGAELARGKAGRVIGNLVALLTTVKGLPLSYNRDLQEDKEPLFDTADTLGLVLPLTAAMVRGIAFNLARMREAADDPYVGATDLADHLVLRGMPFREAHAAVGALVARLAGAGRSIREADPATLREFCPLADPAFARSLSVDKLISARRTTPGGTAWERVSLRIAEARDLLAADRRELAGWKSNDPPVSPGKDREKRHD
ncbi:MAG: argininosuccinate lyase [Deltaproteobacteria bacterium]|nr:argininosuccinate lyase [Deltaproteobacteria bacterium]